MKLYFTITFILISALLFSITYTVKQDGTGDFSQIQQAIDAAIDNDIVLVYPGTYYENLVIEGKDITLASLEYTTNDENYVEQTVIDGNMDDSVIYLRDNQCDIIIRGFTIQHGLGHMLSTEMGYEGGAIFIGSGYNISLINCKIHNNFASIGGAIFISSSNLTISGTDIYNNFANSGGAFFFIFTNGTNVTFDSQNRCNIYNNNAGSGRDLFASNDMVNITVIVDTFTVMNPDSYYACHLNDDSHFSFDIQHAFIQPIENDLYVSTDGYDANSGLSASEPLQTINWAMQKIASNPNNPHTIHLASGTYSQSLNNQFFPIGIKSYVTLQGDENDRPILLNEGIPETEDSTLKYTKQKFITIKNIIVHQNLNLRYIMFSNFADGEVNLLNITLEDIESNVDNALFAFGNNKNIFMDTVELKNITNNRCIGPYCLNSNLTLRNCVWDNNHSTITGDDMGYPCLYATGKDSLLAENCKFINNGSTADWGNIIAIGPHQFCNPKIVLKNVLCAYNQTTEEMINLGFPYSIEEEEKEKQILNCTFANNTSYPYTAVLSGNTRITNSIFHNFSNHEIFLADLHAFDLQSELTVDHSLIRGGENDIVNDNDQSVINWLEGNISSNPAFIGEGDYPFALADTSPCVDAGTLNLPEGLTLPETDLAGNPRIVNGMVDMGAYENQNAQYAHDNEVPQIKYTRLKIYPNPFRIGKSKFNRSIFKLTLAKSGNVKIAVYNLKGQKVANIMNAMVAKGIYKSKWDGKNDNGQYVCSGVYFCKVSIDGKEIKTKKMTIIKR